MSSCAVAKKKKKRKKSVVSVVTSSWRPIRSKKRARKVTSEFHKLYSEKKTLEENVRGKRGKAKIQKRLAEVNREIEMLGGHRAYQSASILTTAQNRSTSRWVFRTLNEHSLRPRKGQSPLKVLEIGAINTQILSCAWMDVTAIDLNSNDPRIRQRDFFEIVPEGGFDVLVCAMVLNFVPNAWKRGEMILRAYEHLKLGGHFFLVLPSRCISKSKFVDRKTLLAMLAGVGFDLCAEDSSPKIDFFYLRKVEPLTPTTRSEGGNEDRVIKDRRASLSKYCKEPAVAFRGRKRTNAFAVAFREGDLNCTRFKGKIRASEL